MMMDAISFGFLSFTSLFMIIDPIAVAPVFVAMTEKYEMNHRRKAALKACAVALAILAIFAVCGGLIFRLFGITIDALRIAGGILFFGMSMKMLTSSHPKEHLEHTEADPSIVPLGMPLICGPGAISTVMVLMGQNSSLLHAALFFVALIVAIMATALTLIAAPYIIKFIGKTGVNVVTKIIGLIMCALGVQFVIDGVKPVVIGILLAIKS
ncbi:MAG: NAAT family transporter [Blastocatellia bacterium]|nr:NAAT family transporter [Blastocatellia bacterium]